MGGGGSYQQGRKNVIKIIQYNKIKWIKNEKIRYLYISLQNKL